MTEKKFTRNELANYNGDNNKPHYMAIEGIVYDITNASKLGISTKNLMELIFGRSKDKHEILQKLPVVGKLSE